MASLGDVRIYEHFITRGAIMFLLYFSPRIISIFSNNKLIIDNQDIVFAEKIKDAKTKYHILNIKETSKDLQDKNDQTLMYEIINLAIFSSIAATPLVPTIFTIKYLYTKETKDIFPAICFFLMPPYANVLLNTAIIFSEHCWQAKEKPVIHDNINDSSSLRNLLVSGMKTEKNMWARG